ncbi:hypothetical protein R1flu_006493 [Riccia fluitans]|uniref:Uncharacterized protein n=1 Tax=Riccia fluitans TaxID=41844 RepID=A0ABD1YW58_9MARC
MMLLMSGMLCNVIILMVSAGCMTCYGLQDAIASTFQAADQHLNGIVLCTTARVGGALHPELSNQATWLCHINQLKHHVGGSKMA